MRPEPRSPRASAAAKIAAVVVASALVHAAALGSPGIQARVRGLLRGDLPPPPVLAARVRSATEPIARRASIFAERRDLVDRAREARSRGALALGEFLLTANALDAAEEGASFDHEHASALYAARVAALREALARQPLLDAVPEIFGDLHYFGRSGGRMGDALVEGGGACEPVSQLVAAAIHDAGLRDGAWLRFYGGAGPGGINHLAAVHVEHGREHDLLSGEPARRSGTRFPAEDLVEAYARAHDLAPPLLREEAKAAPGAGSGDPSADQAWMKRSLALGYPPNADRFPGTMPLYATRAVHARGEAAEAEADEGLIAPATRARECGFFVRPALLDPPAATIGEGDRGFPVEIRRTPGAAELDRTFSLIAAVEPTAEPSADPADRLMGLACLAALYDQAALDLTLASQRALAEEALEKQKRVTAAGAALLTAGGDQSALEERLGERFSGRTWILVFLPGGEDLALRLAEGSPRNDWGRINALAALVVARPTRARAIERVEKLSLGDQIEVMHELFHAHDRLRPWASNYPLDPGGPSTFARAYRAFRGLAWSLWVGAGLPEETLDGMERSALAEGLPRGFRAALLGYYAKQGQNLHRHRADNVVFARAVGRWIRDHGYGDLEAFHDLVAAVELN